MVRTAKTGEATYDLTQRQRETRRATQQEHSKHEHQDDEHI
jgi:hypothetical protein